MNTEPIMAEAYCNQCSLKWNAFFPDGIEKDVSIECPKCGDNYGELL